MSDTSGTEKYAQPMSPSEKRDLLNKYLGYGAGAALLTAGIGLVMSRVKANRERVSYRPENSRNAITVNILKDNFMKDVPTPDQQAKQVAGRIGDASGMKAQQEGMSDADIAKIKKDIVRRNERKMNFFGTKYADNEVVTNQEKVAELGFIRSLKETGKGMVDSGTVKPMAMAAGAVSAIYLSSMIVDKINEMRAAASKRRVDAARKEYVRLVQGNDDNAGEKEASAQPQGSGGILNTASTIAGASFVMPAVLSAIIVNKIWENRRESDKKRKDSTNSFPEDPVILYKTSDDHEIKMHPEAALSLILLKQAMHESDDGIVKVSLDISGSIGKAKDNFLEWAKSNARYVTDPYGAAADDVISQMKDPSNEDLMKGMADAYMSHGDTNKFIDELGLKLKIPSKVIAGWNRQEVKRRVLNHPKISDTLADVVNRDSWSGWRKDQTKNYLVNTTHLFTEGSPLYKIVMWILNNVGVGKLFARNIIQNKLNSMKQIA